VEFETDPSLRNVTEPSHTQNKEAAKEEKAIAEMRKKGTGLRESWPTDNTMEGINV